MALWCSIVPAAHTFGSSVEIGSLRPCARFSRRIPVSVRAFGADLGGDNSLELKVNLLVDRVEELDARDRGRAVQMEVLERHQEEIERHKEEIEQSIKALAVSLEEIGRSMKALELATKEFKAGFEIVAIRGTIGSMQERQIDAL